MACSISKIKKDSLAHVRKTLKGKADSITVGESSATFAYGDKYKVKTKISAIRTAEKKQKKIETWAEDLFGKSFGKGWTDLKVTDNSVMLDFRFPTRLEQGFKILRGKQQKRVDQQKIVNDKGAQANEYVYGGEVYSSREDMIQAMEMDEDFFPAGKLQGAAQFNAINYITAKEIIQKRLNLRIAALRASKRNGATDVKIDNEIATLKAHDEKITEELLSIKSNPEVVDELLSQFDKDIDFIKTLIEDTIPNSQNITDALHIMNYYNSILSGLRKNKIVEADDFIQVQNSKELDQKIQDKFDQIAVELQKIEEDINIKQKRILLEIIDNMPNVDKAYPGMSNEEIMNDMLGSEGDITVADRFFQSVDKTLVGNDSLLAEMIRIKLDESITKAKSEIKPVYNAINNIEKTVADKLVKMGYGLSSTIGSVIYQNVDYKAVFYRKTANGNLSNALIDVFSDQWSVALKKNYKDVFYNEYSQALAAGEWQKVRKISRDKYNWLKANTNIIDVRKLPEILSDSKFAHHSDEFLDASEAQQYKAELIADIGEYKYHELVAKQVAKIDEFDAYMRKATTDIMYQEKVATYDELSTEAKNKIKRIETRANPFFLSKAHETTGTNDIPYDVGDSNSYMETSNMHYSTYYPKRTKTFINFTTKQKTTKDTGYYDSGFDVIAKDKDLLEFWGLAKKVVTYNNGVLDNGMNQVLQGSMLAQKKHIGEILFDKTLSPKAILKYVGQSTIDWVRELATSSLRYNGMVDMNKINRGGIRTIEDQVNLDVKTSLLHLKRLNKAPYSSPVDLDRSDSKTLAFLAEETEMTVSEMKAQFGPIMEPGKILREYATHRAMQEQSFNLPVALKAHMDMVSSYKAQKEAYSEIKIMERLYRNIELDKNKSDDITKTAKAVTESLKSKLIGSKIQNTITKEENKETGLDSRVNGIARVDSFIKKNLLNQSDPESFWKFGVNRSRAEKKFKEEAELRIEEINEELKNQTLDTNVIGLEEEKEMLEVMVAETGRFYTAAAAYNGLNRFMVFLGLGWNFPASLKNRFQGVASLVTNDTGKYWTEGNGYVTQSFVNRKQLYKTGLMSEDKKQMDIAKVFIANLDILQDATNEMDRATNKSGFVGKIRKLNPMYIVEYVEWYNQVPQLLAMVMDKRITNPTTGEEIPVFTGRQFPAHELVDGELVLKEEYRTGDPAIVAKNIADWQDFSSKDFAATKQYMSEVNRNLNGDYSATGTLSAKDYVMGKTLMMFKTWLPRALYARFAVGKKSIALGTDDFTGYYSGSFTKNNSGAGSVALSAMFGAGATLMFSPPIAAGMIGFLAVNQLRRVLKKDNGVNEIKVLKEVLAGIKELSIQMAAIPVNTIRGRRVIQGGQFSNTGFTTQEKQNLASMIREAAIISWLAITKMAVMAAWPEEEDEPTDKNNYWSSMGMTPDKRESITTLQNLLSGLASDYYIYFNPLELTDTMSSISINSWADKMLSVSDAIIKVVQGEDIITSGQNQGDSRIVNKILKAAVPNLFQSKESFMSLGFDKLSHRDFYDENMDEFSGFSTDYKLDKDKRDYNIKVYRLEKLKEYKEAYRYDELPTTMQEVLMKEFEKLIELQRQALYPKVERQFYGKDQNK